MNRVIGGLVVVAVLACAPTAGARTTRWNVSATLTGTYTNAVTATADARCPAHYAERVTGLKATFTSPRPIVYDPVARALTGALTYRLTGRWAVTGAYVAQVPQPDGTLTCAATPTPVACSARVIFDDGHRTSTRGRARLSVDTNAKGAIVSRITAPRLTEQYVDAGQPPHGWPPVCTLSPDVEALPATPLFGLASTEILDRALAAKLRLPAKRLARGTTRPIVVRGAVAHTNGCPALGFDPCAERGSFGVRVRLSQAER